MREDSNLHVSLRELAPHERPQERLERLGPAPLTDRELLAMLLRSGTAKKDVLALADDLITQAGSLGILPTFGKSGELERSRPCNFLSMSRLPSG